MPGPPWPSRSPYVLALMVFIVVCLFNSIRTTLLIWLIMPLFIIGVTAGLLLTRHAVRVHGPARRARAWAAS